MNNNTMRVLCTAVVLMLSTPVFAATWQTQAPLVDNVIKNLVPPGGQTSQYTYQQYIQDQINSLNGFAPIPPFWQCSLVTFQLNGTNDGITMVSSGKGNGCGVGISGGSGGPTGAGGTGSAGPSGVVGSGTNTPAPGGVFQ
jgi:hypothetical protein